MCCPSQPKNETQAISLSNNCLYLLSHLASPYSSLSVRVHVSIVVYMHVGACKCGSQSSTSGMLPRSHTLYFLRQGLSLAQGSSN